MWKLYWESQNSEVILTFQIFLVIRFIKYLSSAINSAWFSVVFKFKHFSFLSDGHCLVSSSIVWKSPSINTHCQPVKNCFILRKVVCLEITSKSAIEDLGKRYPTHLIFTHSPILLLKVTIVHFILLSLYKSDSCETKHFGNRYIVKVIILEQPVLKILLSLVRVS